MVMAALLKVIPVMVDDFLEGLESYMYKYMISNQNDVIWRLRIVNGHFTLHSQILGGFDETKAEEILPNAVYLHTGR